MQFQSPLIRAKILNRYKRFLADIELPNGEVVVAHVPNTGAMTTCWAKGWDAYLSESDNPKRKLKYTLEMTSNGSSLISVNTSITNKIAYEALTNGSIEEVTGYRNIKPEQKVLDSRIDFYLSENENQADAYLEVKNVTLRADSGLALFPDAVSTRGQKHLLDLIELKKKGFRAIMLYIINREDVEAFMPAADIDKTYTNLLLEAQNEGVEILAYQSKLTTNEIRVTSKVPVFL